MEGQTEMVFTEEDISNNKVISALAYLLFFLPLIVCPESPFGRFHANQALLLTIAGIAGSLVFTIIPIIGWIILSFYSLGICILALIGLVRALNGKAQDLPIIGKYRLLK